MNKKYSTPDDEEKLFGLGEDESKELAVPESYYHNISVPEKKDGEDRYYEVFEKSKHKNLVWSVVSVVLAVLSAALSFLGVAGLIIGALAVAFAVVSRFWLGYFDTLSVVGMVAGIFGMVFSTVFIIWPYMVSTLA